MREARWVVRTRQGYLAEGGAAGADLGAAHLFPDAESALKAAGELGGELLKVLVHYGREGNVVDVEPWED